MREEAHAALAAKALTTKLRAVLVRVEPALEHAVGHRATVTLRAAAFPEIGASGATVVVHERVASAGLLAFVGVRALHPVVRAGFAAKPNLRGQGKHQSEFIKRIRCASAQEMVKSNDTRTLK